ncbi:serine/threonine-protein kinase STY13-like [Prosopis cineraria]|uniref:serine/threonine-protein kinase STY13-like n=1 Tax=Prosopis cineraria TaxID=364024 RepID=UPI00240F465D|nr:serine/threonine-protein kinase STY13-like [Prosopis cineraria]
MAEKLNDTVEDDAVEKPDSKEKKLSSKVKEKSASFNDRGICVRADKIDFKDWDCQLDKHLNKVLSREATRKRKEDWEIDSSKLDIRRAIDHGAYGTVYRGVYDGQDVAVKVFDWRDTDKEAAAIRASFQQEVAAWHKLNHPNVTKFVGASIGNSFVKISSEDISNEVYSFIPAQACCVLEFVPGGTLKKFLMKNRRKKLDFDVAIQLALDLSRGLSYLHSKKIVHRDVKTENILLDANGTAKIADFGVARIEALNPCEMTGGVGTPCYMAPEVLNGKPYNKKCDVYSFGICLWEIYCCDLPYPTHKFSDVFTGVVRQNLRPEIPRCCPSSLSRIMRKCWDEDPDKRPQMEEVVRMLEAIDTSKGRRMISKDQSSFWCFCPGGVL